jgi:hypothetical protein
MWRRRSYATTVRSEVVHQPAGDDVRFTALSGRNVQMHILAGFDPGCVKTPRPKTKHVRERPKSALDAIKPPTRQLSRAFF